MNASFLCHDAEAHIGLGMTVVGGGLSSIYSVQSDVRLAPGDKVSVGAYEFNFAGYSKEFVALTTLLIEPMSPY